MLLQADTLNKREFKPYISGLKGIACLLIMICHYLGLYKYAEEFSPSIPLLDPLCYSFLSDEQYWVYLFFIISGYLVAGSTIKTFPALIKKMILRILRFVFPILFSALTIYLIGLLLGFFNTETTGFFSCAWFQNAYYADLDLCKVILSPYRVLFQGNSSVNPPYWVLRDMLIGACVIYIIRWISKTWKDELTIMLIFGMIILHFFLSKAIVASCLLGMLVFQIQYGNNYWDKRAGLSVMVLCAAFCLRFLSTMVLSLFFFAALLLLVPYIYFLNKLLSSRPLNFLGDISWGVYSFHWPILCSVGSLILVKTTPVHGLAAAYLTCMSVSCILTLILAFLFHLSFERLSSFLIRKLDMRWKVSRQL